MNCVGGTLQVFHHMLLREFSSEELNSAFRRRPIAFGAILNGNLGLDTLFLISGFLAALVLIPTLEQPRGSTWRVSARCCLLRATHYNTWAMTSPPYYA
jgi:peptidoglycan/LPS O-acetylase OafA/YrhL